MTNDWLPVAGTHDFTSRDGRFYAVYKYTHPTGHPVYWVFALDCVKRKMTNACSIGGLPSLSVLPDY
jgi:hypothetical protein